MEPKVSSSAEDQPKPTSATIGTPQKGKRMANVLKAILKPAKMASPAALKITQSRLSTPFVGNVAKEKDQEKVKVSKAKGSAEGETSPEEVLPTSRDYIIRHASSGKLTSKQIIEVQQYVEDLKYRLDHLANCLAYNNLKVSIHFSPPIFITITQALIALFIFFLFCHYQKLILSKALNVQKNVEEEGTRIAIENLRSKVVDLRREAEEKDNILISLVSKLKENRAKLEKKSEEENIKVSKLEDEKKARAALPTSNLY
jgi:hypothetical protein